VHSPWPRLYITAAAVTIKGCDSNLGPLTPQSDALTTRLLRTAEVVESGTISAVVAPDIVELYSGFCLLRFCIFTTVITRVISVVYLLLSMSIHTHAHTHTHTYETLTEDRDHWMSDGSELQSHF